MTRPTPLRCRDKNGVDHECLGEAFRTKYDVFLLVYPTKALASSTIFVPATFSIVRP